jgi:hypothetical protein
LNKCTYKTPHTNSPNENKAAKMTLEDINEGLGAEGKEIEEIEEIEDQDRNIKEEEMIDEDNNEDRGLNRETRLWRESS